ncbi:MAG: hypothetical protein M1819_005966 [Sarea resinae]|nr:MAG: hypothetical protein M1819_005966 [Sarea resinae]
MAEMMDVDSDGPRGTKRKAEEAVGIEAPRRIKALDQDVVNKIAAGEIIVAPVHALKELIENAVDAGSTLLEIVVKDGGLKLLQITDNGHGINRDDLPILCERFTTSKLKAFEDLTSIGTYGFRGEALASISHIAHLTVTTKTKESSCAWRAHYAAGKLVPTKPGQSPEPKPTAGRQGTQITVEDLFFNVPTRRRAFRSASEEYAKILDIVGRYAIHCNGVGFSCKKHGDSAMGISIPSTANAVDRIRHIHGSSVANELIKLHVADDRWAFKSEGWISNANYHVKRMILLLFINHRAIESSVIKKAVEQTYSTFLPKGGHPFVYLSLEIDPQRVDVNVHPTKREVNFLNEDEIIETICNEIRVKLANVDTSRTFMTQSLLPGARIPTITESSSNNSPSVPGDQRSAQRPYENSLVRTDAKIRKITSMLPSRQAQSGRHNPAGEVAGDDMEYEVSDKEPVLCRLATIKELRAEVRENMHNDLTELFAGHTFVGIVDERRRIAAIQGGVKLYLVDYGMICKEYFYQVGLTDFANFGSIRFEAPLRLHDLLSVAATHEKGIGSSGSNSADIDWEEAVQLVEKQLIERREMLQEYFSLEISPEGDLIAIPLLLKGYTPSLAKLPRFLLRLGPAIDWTDEKGCFATFLHELASFYVPESLPPPPPPPPPPPTSVAKTSNSEPVSATGAENEATGIADDPGNGTQTDNETCSPELAARREQLNRVVENTMFPAFRARLLATKGLLPGVIEVANLKGLYRIFERC